MERRALLGSALSVLVAIAAAACGGGSSGGGGGAGATVNGTFGGSSLTVRGSAAANTVVTCPQQGSTAFAVVAITDYANTCSVAQAGANKANSTELDLGVFRGGTQAQQPIAAGTYTISSSPPQPDANGNVLFAFANFDKWSSTCQNTIQGGQASSGTITFTSVTSSKIAGSFDVGFPNGGRFSGNFDTAVCIVPSSTLCGSGSPSCQP